MEGVDIGSAIGSVTSSPSSYEQMYCNLDICFSKEFLPSAGPIPPELSDFGSEEEEPFVKDICREERQCSSILQWTKKKRRSRWSRKRDLQAAQTLLDIKYGQPSLPSMVLPKHDLQAAQTLLDIKNGQPSLPSSPKSRDQSRSQVQFLFKKKLTFSDVKYKRMVLPKKEAEIHLADVCPRPADVRSQIVMEDFDTGQRWVFGYRLWTSEKKIMHILENTGELIEDHNLQVEDLIYFYKDSQGNYVVQGVSFQQ